MRKTEKNYWVNGHQVRGGWFHTFNVSLFGFGLMISWGKPPTGEKIKNRIMVFKLV